MHAQVHREVRNRILKFLSFIFFVCRIQVVLMDFLKQVLLQVLARESRRLSTLRRRTRSKQRRRGKQMRQKERSKLPQ